MVARVVETPNGPKIVLNVANFRCDTPVEAEFDISRNTSVFNGRRYYGIPIFTKKIPYTFHNLDYFNKYDIRGNIWCGTHVDPLHVIVDSEGIRK